MAGLDARHGGRVKRKQGRWPVGCLGMGKDAGRLVDPRMTWGQLRAIDNKGFSVGAGFIPARAFAAAVTRECAASALAATRQTRECRGPRPLPPA